MLSMQETLLFVGDSYPGMENISIPNLGFCIRNRIDTCLMNSMWERHICVERCLVGFNKSIFYKLFLFEMFLKSLVT
jgi:hypothetical protein